jgi:hypothetical protein
MVTKELLISEIEKLDEKYFDEIYEIVFWSKAARRKPGARQNFASFGVKPPSPSLSRLSEAKRLTKCKPAAC